ncbi:MAG: 30S ribosomal protein S16 [Planctomycetes bacterium]|nr:30S ribosomal protein S16 [Planctomycetota bacterium]
MVKLRLKRIGRNHTAFYRIGAMDIRNPRDGRVLEYLGAYDPQNKDSAKQLVLNSERVQAWLKRGAQPTDTVAALLKKAGIKA